jgi:hypothetical protein
LKQTPQAVAAGRFRKIKTRRFKMRQEKKVKLNKIQVQSFTTVLDQDEQKVVKGGSLGEPGGTAVPIFC